MALTIRRSLLTVVLLSASMVAVTVWLLRDDAAVAASSPDLAPCTFGGISRPTECGTLTVPENRQRAGRTIALRLLVVRATKPAAREAVFFATGGPGTAATASANGLTRMHDALAATHDFVFVDQRGTGDSQPLPCAENDGPTLPPVFSAEAAAQCRKALESNADLLAYTTADAVEDLEAVRSALRYERINLHGSSYGTRLAWAYASAYPQRARTLVLHGPAPPDFVIPLPFPKGLDTALSGLVTDCLADAACGERFPRLKEDVDLAFGRLRAGSARVKLDGGPESDFSRGELAEATRYMLYSATDARRLPLLLSQAAAGDYTPIAQASLNYRRGLRRTLSMGMYLSVTCAEDIPFIDEGAIASTSRDTRLGDYRARQQLAACSAWPKGTPRRADARPVNVPALVQTGAYDPATPLDDARRGMRLLPAGRLVVVPHGAHSFNGVGIDACLSRMTTDFIAAGSVAAVDDSCVAQARRPPFILQ